MRLVRPRHTSPRLAHASFERAVEGRTAVWIAAAVLALIAGAGVVRLGDADNQAKALVLGLMVFAGVVSMTRPAVLIAIPVVAAPFNFDFTLAGLEIGTNNLLLFACAAAVVRWIDMSDTPRWVSWGLGLLVFGSAASGLVAVETGPALFGALRWASVAVLILAAFSIFKSTRAACWGLAWAFALSSVLVVGGALLQRSGVVVPPIGKQFLPDRLDSTFGYYTLYAGYLAIALPIVIGAAQSALAARRFTAAVLLGGSALIAGVGVALSLSRGGLLAAFVGLSVMLLLQVRRPGVLVAGLVLIGAAGVGAIVATPAREQNQFLQRLETRQGGDPLRSAVQNAGLETALNRPLGLGYGNFEGYLKRNVRQSGITKALFHAHRTPVQVALDAGWLGLAGFAILVLGALTIAVMAGLAGRGDAVAAGYAGALAGFLAQGWNDYFYYETSFVIITGVLVWAVVASSRSGNRQDDA